MRNTTLILVILLLAGATVMERRANIVRDRFHISTQATAAARTAWDSGAVDTPEMRRIGAQMEDLDDRVKATESALRSLQKNENAIENLVRGAERDAKATMHRISDSELRAIYEKNLRDLRHQLVETRTALAHLVAQRNALKAQRINLASRLELARITARYAETERISETMGKPSPVDSLGDQGPLAFPQSRTQNRETTSCTQPRACRRHSR